MDETYQKLKEFGDVKINESLIKHTTFKIGGPARLFVNVSKTDKLVGLFNYLSAEGLDYFVVAGGSNLLMSDEGFDGVVVKISTNEAPKITPSGSGVLIEAEAGVKLSAVVNLASKNSLAGIDWAIGIPGTFGGAIRGNAGAMGKEIKNILTWVEVWRDGEVIRLKPEECGFSYRNSDFKHNKDIILRGEVYLEPGNKAEIMERMQGYLKKRAYTPFPSAGSFFKNLRTEQWLQDKSDLPELFLQRGKIPVGWLNDQLGLRGLSLGGAKISDEHGNYLINFDHATQADVLGLVEQIKQKVYDRYGVELEPEVQIVK